MGVREKRRWRMVGGDIFRFDGLDMRSRRARQLKDILRALIGEFGDVSPHALRELALHRMALEDVQADVIAYKPGARAHAVRMSNCVARIEREFRASGRGRKDSTLSLDEYLAANHAEAAA